MSIDTITFPLSKKEFSDKVSEIYQQSLFLLDKTLNTAYEQGDLDIVKNVQEDILQYVLWSVRKTKLRYSRSTNTEFPLIKSGLYWVDLGQNIGSEYNKRRPVVIVTAISKSPICTVIPLSTKRKRDNRWYHIDLEDRNNTAMCEHLKVISKARIVKPVHLTNKDPFKDKKKRISVLTESDVENIKIALDKLYGNPF